MKIICKNKTIDLNKYDIVRIGFGFGGEYGYLIEATRKEPSGGIFGGIVTIEEEIVWFNKMEIGEQLVKAITEAWIVEEKFFNVEKWLKERDSEDIKYKWH